jgi:hypothetical protein
MTGARSRGKVNPRRHRHLSSRFISNSDDKYSNVSISTRDAKAPKDRVPNNNKNPA